MPHIWASAECLRLTRHGLVSEMKSKIHLRLEVPPEWVAPGLTTTLQDTPMRNGPVDFIPAFDSHADAKLTLKLDTRGLP